MGARLRSWWQQIRTRPVASVLIALLIMVIVLIVLSVLGYIFNWDWVGLGPYISSPHPNGSNFQRGKTLWDWLQLLIIPAVLAVAGYGINLTISRSEQEATKQRAHSEREAAEKRAETEREIALDNQRETALQAYLNSMSELLLHENLRNSEAVDKVRDIARVRALTTLPRLDLKRKGSVLLFLAESGLISIDDPIINLYRADLSRVQLYKPWLEEVNLQETNLSEADLYEADLFAANLSKADLYEAHLIGAKLYWVNLREADLRRADLHRANLEGANLSEADLSEADLQRTYLDNADLSKATMRAANLSEADLRNANLQGATLFGANLHRADLANADLSGADLSGVIVTQEQWEKAKSLTGATMPDGSIHP
jgi:uncharacterized protein YjbI with pentapeptide repeats